MISTKLGVYQIPTSGKRVLQRRIKLTKLSIQKQAKAKIRKLRSEAKAAIKSQYYIQYAFADLRRYIARNEDIFIISAITMLIIGYAATVSAVEFMLMFLNTAYGISQITGLDISLMILTAFTILVTLYAWVLSFAMNTMSIAIVDGANRKKKRSARQTLRKGLARASRVTIAGYTLGALIVVPIILAALLSYLYLHITSVSEEAILNFVPRAIIASIAWACVVLMQFGLITQVALFEPQLNLRQMFTKARRLVIKKGRVFLLLGYSIAVVALLISYQLSKFIERFLMLNKWVAMSFFIFGLAMVGNGILVALYQKRRLSRK